MQQCAANTTEQKQTLVSFLFFFFYPEPPSQSNVDHDLNKDWLDFETLLMLFQNCGSRASL